MSTIAILIANAHYEREDDLPCCLEDLAALEALMRAAERHETIRAKADATADEMRELIRDALPATGDCTEVFFYFSGHGAAIGSEFYFCGTNFHGDRPNETGLSQTELHDFVRSTNANLFVKVVDACFSGTLLVKSERQMPLVPKDAFRHVVQIASSLNDQQSFGGNPLSNFTRGFCEAAARKTEGQIYFSDIINTLRDDFLDDEQTPFFVSQGTARELFCDEAAKLDSFRGLLASRWAPPALVHGDATGTAVVATSEPQSLKQFFEAAEDRIGNPDIAAELTGALFERLTKAVTNADFSELFQVHSSHTDDYYEPSARDLIISVLSREVRPDRLVTAEIEGGSKKNPLWGTFASAMALLPDKAAVYTLKLNCKLDRAQLRISLTPKYRSLQEFLLVVSCAPSLEHCYVFEILTLHPRTSWDGFGQEAREVVRRWYKLEWSESPDRIIGKIVDAFKDAVKSHLDEVASRLGRV